MSLTPPQTRPDRRTTAPVGGKSSIVLPAVVVGLLIIGGGVAYKLKMFESAPPAAPVATTPVTVQKPAVFQPVAPREETASAPAAPVAVAPEVAVTPAPARVSAYVPPVDARQLMTTLTSLGHDGTITAEDAQKAKEILRQLVQQGPSSVAAIREYLALNQDQSYGGVTVTGTGNEQVIYSSLRSGLLDALGQIGGPESTAAMLQTMQTSTFPTDIATLAATLQQQAPGQYDGEILSAVRAQLALAAQDQLGNANVGPLFQLLAGAAANGTDVSADLTQYSSKWPFYAAIELANLPNGAGVSSLVQMVQNNTGGSQSAAAEALAQMAPQNSSALSVLTDLAKQGQLSDAVLADLASYLGGRENGLGSSLTPGATSSQGIHISNGNQDFTAADYLNALTPDQITQHISAIDQILQSLPSSDTQAQAALQQQKTNLTGRQTK